MFCVDTRTIDFSSVSGIHHSLSTEKEKEKEKEQGRRCDRGRERHRGRRKGRTVSCLQSYRLNVTVMILLHVCSKPPILSLSLSISLSLPPSLSVYKLLYCFYFGLVQCSLPWKQTKMLLLFIISWYGQKKKKKKKKKEGEKTSGENQTEEAKVRKFSINMQENGGNFFLITYLV